MRCRSSHKCRSPVWTRKRCALVGMMWGQCREWQRWGGAERNAEWQYAYCWPWCSGLLMNSHPMCCEYNSTLCWCLESIYEVVCVVSAEAAFTDSIWAYEKRFARIAKTTTHTFAYDATSLGDHSKLTFHEIETLADISFECAYDNAGHNLWTLTFNTCANVHFSCSGYVWQPLGTRYDTRVLLAKSASIEKHENLKWHDIFLRIFGLRVDGLKKKCSRTLILKDPLSPEQQIIVFFFFFLISPLRLGFWAQPHGACRGTVQGLMCSFKYPKWSAEYFLCEPYAPTA